MEPSSETEEMGEMEKNRRRSYSRSEMEELRFVDAGEKQRRWKEVYQMLNPVVAQEYDGLRAPDNRKQQQQQQQQQRGNFERKQYVGKKKEAPRIMGEMFAVSTVKGSNVLDLSNVPCDGTLVGSENNNDMEDPCDEYEDSYDGDDSSSDEYDSIQRPAFLVEGEPDFDSGPPLDGLEYLRRVRWEAAQIPKVKVAKLNLSEVRSEQTPYMPKIPEITKCPLHLLPSKQWEDAFLADFSELRKAFSLLENSCNQPSFAKIHDDSCKQYEKQSKKNSQTLTTILAMDAVSRAATLRNSIRSLETASILSRDDCVGLFALCATVDAPLDAETYASLRCLLRKCSSLLALKSEPDDEVAMLSILVAITGKYFGQSENLK